MDPEFLEFFKEWSSTRNVYFVTGSDYAKTVEQVTQELCESVSGVYNCAGNVLYKKGELFYEQDFQLEDKQIEFLRNILVTSEYPWREGNHIEKRPGLVNFSVIGRNAIEVQRKDYRAWDLKTDERKTIAKQFSTAFPELEATVAGEIGIDIYLKGFDKSQILKDFDDYIVFFGDATYVGGNDHSIALAVEAQGGQSITVRSWNDTYQYLKRIYTYPI
jgi:phosphomannomutase